MSNYYKDNILNSRKSELKRGKHILDINKRFISSGASGHTRREAFINNNVNLHDTKKKDGLRPPF
ncbi:hypothetical protein EV194_108108 [Natronoflexus pectinivorans]|uniref:Uncharacterized protein n=1 Tax=Natronoflexus pectinivorans TaxID=682526 RepID=A0A4R2GJH7_9BACT|nr:hypothetical protein EV194_108108 [Natronoflexus pectinivorans]